MKQKGIETELPGEIQTSDTPSKHDSTEDGLNYLEKHPSLWGWAEDNGRLLFAKATSRGSVIIVVSAGLAMGAVGLGILLNREFQKRQKERILLQTA